MWEEEEIGAGGWIFLMGIAILTDGSQIFIPFVLSGASFVSTAAVSWIPFVGLTIAGLAAAISLAIGLLIGGLISIVAALATFFCFKHFKGKFTDGRMFWRFVILILELLISVAPLYSITMPLGIIWHNRRARKAKENEGRMQIEAV